MSARWTRVVGLAPMAALLVLLVAALLAAAGCGGTAQLEPGPGAVTVAGGEIAIELVAGVRMAVEAAAWPGEAGVVEEVTPLEVTIENESGDPLRVAYEIFSLVDDTGRHLRAMPPFEIAGGLTAPTLVGGPIAVGPAFQHRGFLIAPYMSSAYDDMAVAHHPFYFDPLYRAHYSDYWGGELPTPQMLQRALPEGELEPGGSVKGWLYFERVDPKVERLVFRAELIAADDRTEFGRISVPFRVTAR